MKKLFITSLVGLPIGILLLSTGWVTPEYMKDKPVPSIVIDKMIVPGGHKSSGRLYLICREKKTGDVFEVDVSPSKYSQYKVGDEPTWFMAEHDYKKRTHDKSSVMFFLVLISTFFFGASVLTFLISFSIFGFEEVMNEQL